jgi:hypothetical protein
MTSENSAPTASAIPWRPCLLRSVPRRRASGGGKVEGKRSGICPPSGRIPQSCRGQRRLEFLVRSDHWLPEFISVMHGATRSALEMVARPGVHDSNARLEHYRGTGTDRGQIESGGEWRRFPVGVPVSSFRALCPSHAPYVPLPCPRRALAVPHRGHTKDGNAQQPLVARCWGQRGVRRCSPASPPRSR